MNARLALVLFAMLAPLAAPAAEPPGASAPPPPAAADPPPFESVLETYRAYRVDEPATDWRAANAAMGRLGGHGGQLAVPVSSGSDAAPPEPAR